jgi:hypothetical protein
MEFEGGLEERRNQAPAGRSVNRIGDSASRGDLGSQFRVS